MEQCGNGTTVKEALYLEKSKGRGTRLQGPDREVWACDRSSQNEAEAYEKAKRARIKDIAWLDDEAEEQETKQALSDNVEQKPARDDSDYENECDCVPAGECEPDIEYREVPGPEEHHVCDIDFECDYGVGSEDEDYDYEDFAAGDDV